MIHVLAIITAKPGMRDPILKLFHANIPAVRAEKGCIEYGPAVDAEGVGGIQTKLGPDAFVVVEKWESVDALKATHAILAALWAHSAELEKRGSHPLVGHSFVLVTAIEGGGLIAVPGRCKLSLIRKLRPGEDLDDARRDIEAVVRAATAPEVDVTITYPAGRDPAIGGMPSAIDPANEAVRLLEVAIQRNRPDRGKIQGAPFWSEASFLTARGIPTVYFAPGDISLCHTSEEHVPIDEYLSGIAALAEFIAAYCSA